MIKLIYCFCYWFLDLRSACEEDKYVPVKEAKKMALECDLVRYLEVSSLLNEGLDVLINTAVSYSIVYVHVGVLGGYERSIDIVRLVG